MEQTPEPLYIPRAMRLVQAIEENALEKTFVFDLLDGKPMPYRAGQFVMLTVFEAGEAPFTLCSMPGQQPRVQLTVRRYPGGRVTEALHQMQPGQYAGIRGPFGNGFPLERLVGRDVLVVAGGIGMAPQRGVIEAILSDRERFGRLIVFYGMASPEQMLYRDLMAQWLERDDLELHLTIDRPHPQWEGHVGLVTTLFQDIRVDPERLCITIVGPPVMYPFVAAECEKLGVPDENIFVSLERRMACGVGKCGHCAIKGVYVCIDGPVFTLAQFREFGEG
ncbi:MAG: FAD/NAD(P)-binding protein [Armatimonadota bacterium]